MLHKSCSGQTWLGTKGGADPWECSPEYSDILACSSWAGSLTRTGAEMQKVVLQDHPCLEASVKLSVLRQGGL